MACLALAGGVGGARMAHGLAMALAPDDLIVAVNIGDDFTHLGLRICPDLDTVTYTLAGLANPETGWGVQGETWNAMTALETLDGPAWFRLGDRDLATHLERTRRLASGASLTDVTAHMSARLGIAHRIVPVTDTPVPTVVETADGDLPFQDYFVKLKCEPAVTGFRFDGAADATLAPPLRQAIDHDDIDCVIICPSNPYVSIDPILAVPGMRQLLQSDIPVVAVSPIVGGVAIKGPAAKMMSELGYAPSTATIADHYRGLADGIVIDQADETEAQSLRDRDISVLVTSTVIKTDEIRKFLAAETLAFARQLGA
ncbi:MAG: 2-phospho-L-lactate transferase [Alphaproteobacteria bacterium]